MKKLKELCKNSFGIELEQLIPLQENLIPFGKKAEDAHLFGSRVAAKEPFFYKAQLIDSYNYAQRDISWLDFGVME